MWTVLFCFQSALLCSSGWPKPHSPSAASSRVLRLQVCHHIKSRYLKSIHVCACMCLCMLVCVCVHAHVCMCTRSCVWHTCGQPGVPVLMLHLVWDRVSSLLTTVYILHVRWWARDSSPCVSVQAWTFQVHVTTLGLKWVLRVIIQVLRCVASALSSVPSDQPKRHHFKLVLLTYRDASQFCVLIL